MLTTGAKCKETKEENDFDCKIFQEESQTHNWESASPKDHGFVSNNQWDDDQENNRNADNQDQNFGGWEDQRVSSH